MVDITSAIFVGVKLAVFVSVFVLTLLVGQSHKEKQVHGLNIMAFFFVIIAIVDFLHVMVPSETGILSWLAPEDNLYLVVHSLSVLAGLSIILYITGIEGKIKEYK